jgi:hypothetical protein
MALALDAIDVEPATELLIWKEIFKTLRQWLGLDNKEGD